MSEKYVNVAFRAYATTTLYICDIDDIKVGDFVVVPSWNSELTGRIVSFSKDNKFSLKKSQHILRKANPKEINEVADVFGIAKNPDFIDEDDEDEGFLTNSGYGTNELKKILKKYDKQAEASNATKAVEQAEPKADGEAVAKDENEGGAGYWRYVAIAIMALYFLKDYIFEG